MIPLSNPLAAYLEEKIEFDRVIQRVVSSGNYILGPEVEKFEHEFAHFIGVRHAIAVASGTDALALSLRALRLASPQVMERPEVITAANTSVATIAAIEQSGAVPVLVDIDRRTHNIDFSAAEALTTGRTSAVVPVHLYGRPADMDRAARYREATGVPIVEDASQAHGATWRGQRVGSFGAVAAFSCYPTKNLGALGDAGVVTTQSDRIADKLRLLRQYGWADRNWSVLPGFNSRMDELQAAILRVRLASLDRKNMLRVAIAERFSDSLANLPIVTPGVSGNEGHVFHLYVCEVEDRDQFRAFLSSRGVTTGVHYPHALKRQPAYQGRVRSGPLPVVERKLGRIVSLPLFPEMSQQDVDYVISAIKHFFT